jgi:alpha-L-fucosidase 2
MAVRLVYPDKKSSSAAAKALKIAAFFFMLALPSMAQNALDQYNVVWNSPSKDSAGSMPLGNGDIGLNVWVEESGDLVFYIGKTDAWSESARLLKLGRVRVRFSPNPFAAGEPFRQTLKLSTGEILINGGKAGSEIKLRVWVDANQPVIRVESDTTQNTEIQVIYERWRDQQRRLEGQELASAFGLDQGPEPVISYGDTIQQDVENRVVWYHRNARSYWPGIVKLQGMLELASAFEEPLLHRTFGAAMQGEGFTKINQTTLRSSTPRKQQAVSIYALTMNADPIDQWLQELNQLIARVEASKVEDRRTAHEKWWQEFWNRSWMRVSGGTSQKTVSSGYALQRFLNACGGRGAQPIKFNGSIFTVDAKEKDESFDAD